MIWLACILPGGAVAQTYGTVTDESGDPLGGITVTWADAGEMSVTAADGTYSLDADMDLCDLPTRISFSSDCFDSSDAPFVEDCLNGNQIDAILTHSSATFGVTVMDSYGNPVTNATVAWNGSEPRSTNNNTYIFQVPCCGAVAGTVVVAADCFEFASVGYAPPCNASSETSVTLVPSPVSFGGKITDCISTIPVPGATLTWHGNTAIADTNGAYFFDQVAWASDTLAVSAAGFITNSIAYAPGCAGTNQENVCLNQIIPSVTIASPTNGSILCDNAVGETYIVARTVPDADSVVFYLNGQYYATVTGISPYTNEWLVLDQGQNGTNSWTAVAYNADGSSATSAVVRIVVSLGPTVSWAGPANNTKYTNDQLVTLAAIASDCGVAPGNVTGVTFYDGNLGYTATNPQSNQWTYTWPITRAAQGTHVFKVVAYSGIYYATSAPVSLVVSYPTTPPTVRITSPANNTVFSNTATTVTISVLATDAVGVASVSLYNNGVLAATLSSAPYNYSWTIPAVSIVTNTWVARVTDNAGNSASSAALQLLVRAAPEIIVEPVGTNISTGSDVSFSVGAAGSAPLAYQWYYDGSAFAGRTNAVLSLVPAATNNIGNYSVVVTNLFGTVTSAVAALTVGVPPFITAQPQSVTVTNGQPAVFNAMAVGTAPLSYEWLLTGAAIAGATTATLTIPTASANDAGDYSVIITNAYGETTSAVAVLTVVVPPAFVVLHSFSTAPDGYFPKAGMVESGNSLFGTTSYGGASGGSALFKVSSAGSGYGIVYNLPGSSSPGGLASSGSMLYGAAGELIFGISTNGSGYSALHSFSGSAADGAAPVGVTIAAGNLFGTAVAGGTSNLGTVFSMMINGLGFTVVHSFTNSPDGAFPEGKLVFGSNALYGTTSQGGSKYGYGTIFAVNADGTGYQVLHTFSGILDGAYPYGDLVLSGDTLYGTTENGGTGGGYGTVFSIHTDGTAFTTLHSFTGGSDGANPEAGVVLSGNRLYGTASAGGIGAQGWPTHNGTIFAVNTDGTDFTVLYTFGPLSSNSPYTNADGANPAAPLVILGDSLYGTALDGGVNGKGTVFSFNLPVGQAPVITNQPAGVTAPVGGMAAFTVGASGTSPLLYQWQFDGAALPGETNAILTLSDVMTNNGGSYSVILTNAYGSATSSPALLTVALPPAITLGQQGGHLTLAWSAVAAQAYLLQYATNLFSDNWSNLVTFSSPTNGTLVEGLPAAADQWRFYRLVLLNP